MHEGSLAQLAPVLVVGGGSMGSCIAAGLVERAGVDASQVTVANPGREKRESLAGKLGVHTVASAAEGLPARTVVLAVKPQVMPQVLDEISGLLAPETLVISIAAGLSTESLAARLDDGVHLVRVMPNTPMQVGCGMSAVCGAKGTPESRVELVRELFATMGQAVVVDESLFDVVTAVSGSGPAYFERVCEVIARAGEELGLDYETSLELALQTMRGTAELVCETKVSLPDAIKAVSSPGGTTVAALDAFTDHGLDEALASGVQVAAARSRELGA